MFTNFLTSLSKCLGATSLAEFLEFPRDQKSHSVVGYRLVGRPKEFIGYAIPDI